MLGNLHRHLIVVEDSWWMLAREFPLCVFVCAIDEEFLHRSFRTITTNFSKRVSRKINRVEVELINPNSNMTSRRH